MPSSLAVSGKYYREAIANSIRGLRLLFVLFSTSFSFAATVHIRTIDPSNTPVANVQVTIQAQGKTLRTAITNSQGTAEIEGLPTGVYDVSASKTGFETVMQNHLTLESNSAVLEFVLSEGTSRNIQIDVSGSTTSQDETSSPGVEISRQEMESMPGNPGTVSDALPLVPGVIKSPNGQIQISGMAEHHSAFLVNSADTTDPVTGQFGLTLPIDSIETMTVLKTPFLAQYGRFTAGVVAIDTRRGGEKWDFNFNDPVPEFRIRSAHIHGLREFTPRLSLTGPIVKNRFYFSEAFTYDIQKPAVRTLLFPFNESRVQSFNSFTQMDYIVSSRHTLTAALHVAPVTQKYANLDFFNPQPVTPNFDVQDYTASLADRISFSSGLLQSTLSATKVQAEVDPQGKKDMILSPSGNRGNYFSEQQRHALRADWLENFSLNPIRRAGVHNLQFGSSAGFAGGKLAVQDRPIDILNDRNLLLRRIRFTKTQPVSIEGYQFSLYAQDHWLVTPKLAFDFGGRVEQQDLTGTLRLAPRLGFQFQPWKNGHTVLRGGYGFFYDQVPLNVFSFTRWPEEFITTYLGNVTPDGQYHNRAEASGKKRFSVVRIGASATSFSPSSAAWNVEIEEKFAPWIHVRAGYSEDNADNLIVLQPEIVSKGNQLVLRDFGRSRYRQIELETLVQGKPGHISFSYVRSLAQGDLNEFDTFLGSFPVPIVPANRFSTLSTDVPNRFLVFGRWNLPKKFHLSPLVEYRSGFPYQTRDALQNFVVGPVTRYPNYFSLDSRIGKDFRVRDKYTLTVSIYATNLTDHFNALAVHTNTADPKFGTFFGSYDRRARLDFDVDF